MYLHVPPPAQWQLVDILYVSLMDQVTRERPAFERKGLPGLLGACSLLAQSFTACPKPGAPR